jgi:hypothetical protein
MSNNKKALWISFFLIVYVVIAVIGFFVVYFIKNAVSKPVVTPIAVAHPTREPVPTGFKTYQNSDQKFSVSYPSTLKETDTAHGFGVNTIELRSKDNANPTYAPDIQILTVPKMLATTIGQDFDSYYAMPDNATKTITSPTDSKTAEVFTKIKNRDISGLRAVEYSSVPSPKQENQEAEIGVFIEKGSDMIIVAGSESNRDQLEKVLTTFSATN